MIRSRLRNKFNKHKTTQNWIAYKSQRNKCTSIRRKNIRDHFSNLCTTNGAPPKKFWGSVKPFLGNKGTHRNENYSLMENGKLIRDDKKIFEIFNDHYINIIKNLTGKKQEESHSVGINTKCQSEKKEMLNDILERI